MFNTWMVFPGQRINITQLTQQQMVHCVIFFSLFFLLLLQHYMHNTTIQNIKQSKM